MTNLTIYNSKREPLVINPDNLLFVKKDDNRVTMAFVGGQETSVKFADSATATTFVDRVSVVYLAKVQANMNTIPRGTTSFWRNDAGKWFDGDTDEFCSQKRTQ